MGMCTSKEIPQSSMYSSSSETPLSLLEPIKTVEEKHQINLSTQAKNDILKIQQLFITEYNKSYK